MSENNLPNPTPDVSRQPDRKRQIADGVLWAGLAWTVASVGLDAWRHQLAAATFQMVVAVGFSAWLWLGPTLARLLDTRGDILAAHRGMAVAQQRMTEAQARMSDIACEAMEEQRRSGTVRVVAERVN